MGVTRKLTALLALLAIAAGLSVAGCGGDSDDGSDGDEPSSERLSAEAYEAKLSEILMPLGTGLQAAGADIGSGGDREAIISGLEEADSLLTGAIDSIQAVSPPEEAQSGHDQLVSAFEGYRDDANELKGIAEGGSEEELATAGEDFGAASTDFAGEIQAAQQALSDAGITLGGQPAPNEGE